MIHRRTTARLPAAWLLAALTATCSEAFTQTNPQAQDPANQTGQSSNAKSDQSFSSHDSSSQSGAATNGAQSEPAVTTFTKGMTEPIPVYKPEPPYTESARLRQIDGTITMMIVIGVDGGVRDVQLKKGIDAGLDESAVETVRTWKFQPATRDGKAVSVRVLVEVSFRVFGRGDAVYVPSHDVPHRLDDLRGVVPPKLVYSPDPEYTKKALLAKLEGTVTLRVTVDEKGSVRYAEEVGPELGMGLDRKALKAVRKWKFQPATREGRPVGVTGTLKVTFKLPDGGS